MKNIYLSVQTGIVVRDLLRCGPLDRLLSHPEVRLILLTPGVRDPAFLAEFQHERVVIVPQVPYAPSQLVWRLMVRRWRYARSASMADVLHRLEERLIPSPPSYVDLFRTYPPALVVSGDPLRPGDANLIATARRHGVPSLGSVRSWDNLLKHLRTRPDALTVWNAINAREAVEVDRYRPDQVTQVGAPQLDPYFSDPLPSREAVCHELGLDPARKTIVLATSSFTYESDQTYLVDLLLEAIRSGEIQGPAQLVVRLHPDDRVGRYLKYRDAPEVVLDIPDRYLATLGWTMTRQDIRRMAGLLRHADVMVNFATTVTLESAITDTPTLLVAFSPIDPDEMQRYVVGLHFRMHYRALVERDLVPIAWDRAGLVGWVNRYLADPSCYRAARQAIVREWVQYTDGRSGQRLAEAILRQAGLATPSQALEPRSRSREATALRVALIGPVPPDLGGSTPGGVATHQAALAAGLARRADLQLGLLATNTRAAKPAAWRCLEADPGYPLYRLYLPGTPLDWLQPAYLRAVGAGRLLGYALRIARQSRGEGSRRETLAHSLWYRHFLGSVRPSLIHVQHPLERHRYLRIVAALEGFSQGRRRCRLPVVVTAHSFFGEHPSTVIERLMAPNLRSADRVIAVSDHIARQAIQLGADPVRVRVIRSGVDLDRFQPRDRLAARRELGIDATVPLILFVGNLEPRKRVDVLLRAVASVRERAPRARLAIIGTGDSAGPDDQTACLQALARELGLGQAVDFLGRVASDDLLRWYAAADAFALPSSSEAQGIAALEAMASGLPVVASAVGGLLDTIDDGRTGYLVPPGEPAPLAARLLDLLDQPALRASIGAAARATVERDFSWERAVAATVEVYREVVTCAAD